MQFRRAIAVAVLSATFISSAVEASEAQWPMPVRKALILTAVLLPITLTAITPPPPAAPDRPLPPGNYSNVFSHCRVDDQGTLNCVAYFMTELNSEWFASLKNADNCAFVSAVPGELGFKWDENKKNPSLECTQYKAPPGHWCKEYR